MKQKIHPTYYENAQVVCASCGNTWTTGSTKKSIHVEVCSRCHPFFSGEQTRILDVEGQVDRFYKKLQARQSYVEQTKAREEAKKAPARPVSELELGPRVTEALAKAGITTIAQLMAKLAEGDEAALAIEGFGRKALIDSKKKIRAMGYELPEAAAQAA
ncbi:MAG: 50S ribosomal protein L31 [Anaerolineales bacterium]|nr:50S ribosomal protein L31 [Anaerolineales bacterium]MCX7756571.1 50S ribosomal protein L31 [Anaerolineales bacterium]